VLTVGTASDPAVVAGADADGTATADRGVLLVAIGADCAPIALATDGAAAAIHAGWRGTFGGVVGAGVAAVRALGAGPVRAVVGPCICVAHYEFGVDALAPLRGRWGDAVVGRTDDGRPALDLRAAIVSELDAAGVTEVELLPACTAEAADLFSFRRDGVTGRHGVVVTRR
jgi:copper oxidase (laccase) domain-containing protein